MNTDDFNFFVECAIKAPSGHNTQPWKFENTEYGIIIHPDFTRKLSIVDKENYELYISLGCALENVLIAAKHRGFQYILQYPNTVKGNINVKLTKDKNNNIQPDILFDYIATRQVTKCKYNKKQISPDSLQQLSTCFNFNEISLLFLDGIENFQKLIPIIIAI